MKDYKCTKIWINEISEISETIDSMIESRKHWLQSSKEEIANIEADKEQIPTWRFEQVEEWQEKIKALEWALNQINAPFKITKK